MVIVSAAPVPANKPEEALSKTWWLSDLIRHSSVICSELRQDWLFAHPAVAPSNAPIVPHIKANLSADRL